MLKPEVSVVTGISLNHMNILGDTLEKIAGEKAGIFKKYAPAVVGRHHPETDSVFTQKADIEASLCFAEDIRIPPPPVPGSDHYRAGK